MKDRQYLEECIIGTCLLSEANAIKAADILTPANFQDEFCRNIFHIIRDRAGKKTIDVVSVTLDYNHRYKEFRAYMITSIMERTPRTHLDHQCLVLLELDIRNKFSDLLTAREKRYVNDQVFEMAAVFKQCRDYIESMENDLFRSIDNMYQYLKQYLKDDIEEFTELYESIPKMVHRIRKHTKIRTLIAQLQSMAATENTYERQKLIEILTRSMMMVMSCNDIPQEMKNILHHLDNSELYEQRS
jgi:replicative DNA helicase